MNTFQFYFQVTKTLAWFLLNACYKLLQWIVWEVTGVNRNVRNILNAPCAGKVAQVLKVRGRFKFCQYLSSASIWDFLLTHESFESPEYVLQEHISLYAVIGEEAIFIECHQNVNIWSSKTCSFSMVAQHDNALKVIKIPMETMHYLADKVGDPKGKLIFLGNCARCGSTLVNQMFEATEKVVAFAEPNCVNFLSTVIDQKSVSGEYSEHLKRKTKSTIRILCNTKAGKVDAYLMKICSPAMDAIPFLKEVFPESYHFYLYREPVKVCQSIYRLSHSFFSINLLFRYGKFSAFRFAKLMEGIGFPASKYRVRVEHDLAMSMVHWCVHMKMYVDLRGNNMPIAAIKYEDIIKDPEIAMSKIFAYCDLNPELVEKSKLALSWDSQVDTVLDKRRMKTLPLLPYTGSTKKECDAICKQYGFPPAEEFKYVDFTITHPNVSMQEILKHE